jgi:hypothetical protein
VLAELQQLQRSVEVLAETLTLFIQMYLSYTPELTSVEQEEARRRGTRRYSQFLRTLDERVPQGHPPIAEGEAHGRHA